MMFYLITMLILLFKPSIQQSDTNNVAVLIDLLNQTCIKNYNEIIARLDKLSLKCNETNVKGIKGDDIIGRKFQDGKIAKSCNEYLKPIESGYDYKGDIGSGFYWIKPNLSQDSFKVYCDMETDGGGWSYYYTTNSIVHLLTTKLNAIHFSENGYFADLRDVEFTDILFVRISDMAKDWFKQNNKIKIRDYIRENSIYMSAGTTYNNFTPNGGAAPGVYQLTIADNVRGNSIFSKYFFSQGIMITGETGCIKFPNHWCNDYKSNFYRADSTVNNRGVCFRENGERHCGDKLMSVAIR